MTIGINNISSYDSASIAQMWQNLFNKIDKNGDGSVDKSEFGTSAPKNGVNFDEIFNNLDSNSDKVISKTEFEDGMKALDQQMQARKNAMQMGSMPPPPPPSEKDGEEIFNSIDQNSDGSIDETELKSALEGTGIDAGKIFKALDANGDNVITKSEFTDSLKKFDEQMQAQAPAMNPAGEGGTDNVQGAEGQTDTSDQNSIGSTGMAGAPAGGGGPKPSGMSAEKVYDDRDTNKDGIVSQSEKEAAEGTTTNTTLTSSQTDQTATTSNNEEVSKSKIIDMLLKAYIGANTESGSSISLLG